MKTSIVVVAILCVAVTTQRLAGQPGSVPAFHNKPPAKGAVLPPVLTPKQLADQGLTLPMQIAAYQAAAKIPTVIYQLRCYCHCDRGHGHTSLHSCFESTYAANSATSMGEALYAYQMSKKGWTPKMIRDGIARGDYKQMDLQHPQPVN